MSVVDTEASSSSSSLVEYDVLFYKRPTHSKVHKSKGQSKMDGILCINNTKQTLTLRCAATDNDGESSSSSEDDDDDHDNNDGGRKKMTWKQKQKQNAKKTTSSSAAHQKGFVYAGKQQGDLMFDSNTILEADTTLLMGGFDVEIVSLRSSSSSTIAAKKSSDSIAAGPSRGVLGRAGLAKKSSTTTTEVKTTTLQSKKAPPLHTANSALPLKRKPIAQPSFLSQPRQSSTMINKRPPVQPARKHAPRSVAASTAATSTTNLDNELEEETPASTPPSVITKRPAVLRKKSNNVVKSTRADSVTSKPTNPQQRSLPSWTPPAPTALKTATTTASLTSTTLTSTTSTMTTTTTTVLSHIPIPASVRKVLRPHQVTGVDFLWKALTTEKGAILADEMGLGKTLMTIAVIAAWHRVQRSQSHIVVCPSSLVRNWEQEFDKWIGKASQPRRVVIRTGGAEGLQLIRAFAANQSQKLANRVGQVLIVSYDLFRMQTSVIQQACEGSIGILIVDEGHRLKNTSGSQTMTALESMPVQSRLLISASPVQNNLSEFYSLVDFVRPGLLGELSSFRKEFERPISAANRKDATPADRETAARQSRHLEALTKNTILRRLQSEVLASVLPPRTELLLFCQLSELQKQMYQSLTQERLKKLSSLGAFTDALETLTDLRKLCTHPHLVKGKKGFPILNKAMATEASGKLVVLAQLLHGIRNTAVDDKVVIVSNFTSALSLIEDLILKPAGFTSLRLDGSVNAQNRQTLVDTFNRTTASRNFCFLLSAKAGGCGLNLVGANRLVMFDPDWNPSTDLQAMGRIYRTGQKRATTIYRLFSTGTLEEIIYQRQLQKGVLASVTVDGRQGQKASFSPEELKECMTLKGNTKSDTKDKMGNSWPESDESTLANNLEAGEPTVQLLESGVLTFVHVVNEELALRTTEELQKAIQEDSVPSDSEGSYSSYTSEEEFAVAPVSKRAKKSVPQPVDYGDDASTTEIADSGDEEEFEF